MTSPHGKGVVVNTILDDRLAHGGVLRDRERPQKDSVVNASIPKVWVISSPQYRVIAVILDLEARLGTNSCRRDRGMPFDEIDASLFNRKRILARRPP